jgi:hypothetical protein
MRLASHALASITATSKSIISHIRASLMAHLMRHRKHGSERGAVIEVTLSTI